MSSIYLIHDGEMQAGLLQLASGRTVTGDVGGLGSLICQEAKAIALGDGSFRNFLQLTPAGEVAPLGHLGAVSQLLAMGWRVCGTSSETRHTQAYES